MSIDEASRSDGTPAEVRPWAARLSALVVLVVGVVVLVGAFTIDSGGAYQAVGPQVFPLIVGAGTTLFGAVALARTFFAPDADELRRAREEVEATHWPAVAKLAAALTGYLVLLVPVGFWQVSTVFFAAVARVLGSRRPLRDAVVGLVLSLAVYFLFDRVLGVSLPPGIVRLAF
ncbi:tripartite tricarboxylate transporter TctB family protein [Saccharopolyspora erythraea]|uniref:tripartite tricarboxylate transporter TctB family protein n=1 Tax=Saccharopolyspora erythraea TaxID=1836 RepID=UPI001BAB146C|nr:tripartite tricarboxylate transporter TctB family protein [Saccharopolyspora erythraea]QUH02004.1 tripartite tricarboxylate transporter TctB family protein [Saccharopolyspora erythraea]